MKTVFQETSLYPNLIDLEMDLSPPCYVHPPLPPQVPQISSGGTRSDTKPSAPTQEGGPTQGTRGRTRGALNVVDKDSPEAPTSPVWALPVRVGPTRPDGNKGTNTGPFPL